MGQKEHIFRPMLAAKDLDNDGLEKLTYPLYVSGKLDGIRALVIRDPATQKPVLVSRSLKPIRSAFAQQMFAREELVGFDGELIYGDPRHPQVFNMTTSAVMTIGSTEPVDFHVFDIHLLETSQVPYIERLESLLQLGAAIPSEVVEHIKVVPQFKASSAWDVLQLEQIHLVQGFEGVIVRSLNGPYKYNRSTLKEEYLLKLKRLKASEATITGFTEKNYNRNAPVIDALGHTKRSASKEGKVGANTLGTLIVEDPVMFPGKYFELGSGFDDRLRDDLWGRRHELIGKIVTYKYFPIGIIDKPRQPIFKGFRHPEDM